MLEAEAADQADGTVEAGRVLALVHLADGADVVVVRTTGALAEWRPSRTVAEQVATGADVSYGTFLAWRGMLTLEPPRRPGPERVSSTAAWRSEDWKFGFVGSRDRTSGALHLPPARVSMQGDAVDDMEPVPMADAVGTVVAFTVDRMAYSPSPPVVFAVVDFEGGGRFPVGAHRRRRRPAGGGRPAGDDLPAAVHGRRHPRLLLEGPPGPKRCAAGGGG